MLFKAKREGELILILDVQSSIVRGTLVTFRTAAVPVVSYAYSVHLPFRPEVDGRSLIKYTLEAIGQITALIRRELHDRSEKGLPHKLSAVHYVLSSPWIISQAKTLAYTFTKPTVVSRKHILDTIEKERSKILPVDKTKVQIIEEKICHVRLNGYNVALWDNKETRQFDVSFVSSVADHNMVRRFEEAAGGLASRGHYVFHSGLLLQYIGIQQTMPELDEYILVHVHGELTDVVAVSKNFCTFFGTFPFGTNSLIRKLSKSGRVKEQTAESMLSLNESGHLDKGHDRSSGKKIDAALDEWASLLSKMLSEASVQPTKETFIVSARSHEELFSRGLKKIYSHNRLEFLSVDSLKTHISFEPRSEQLRLSGLYAIAICSLER